VFYFSSLGGLELCLGGLSPPMPLMAAELVQWNIYSLFIWIHGFVRIKWYSETLSKV